MNQTQGNSMNEDTNILTETNLIESFDSESDGFYVLEMFSRRVNIRLSLRFSHTITSFPHYGRLRVSFLSTSFCTGCGMLPMWDTSLLGTSSDLVSLFQFVVSPARLIPHQFPFIKSRFQFDHSRYTPTIMTTILIRVDPIIKWSTITISSLLPVSR